MQSSANFATRQDTQHDRTLGQLLITLHGSFELMKAWQAAGIFRSERSFALALFLAAVQTSWLVPAHHAVWNLPLYFSGHPFPEDIVAFPSWQIACIIISAFYLQLQCQRLAHTSKRLSHNCHYQYWPESSPALKLDPIHVVQWTYSSLLWLSVFIRRRVYRRRYQY